MNTAHKHRYCFFLGRFAVLSIGEILRYFGDAVTPVAFDRDFVIVETDEEFSQETLYPLGGTIKVGLVLGEGSVQHIETEQELAQVLVETCFPKPDPENEVKFRFAVNTFGKPKYNLSKVLNHTKKKAKATGLSVRFVNKNLNKNISSVVVKKEKLLVPEKGIDINICLHQGTVYVVQSVGAQDFEDYSDRDYGKPVRNMKGGIMPPKLAQIMLNMVVPRDTVNPIVFDPFCGSGTLVMEGMMRGITMIGSDIEEAVVTDAENNIEWLKKKYKNKEFIEPQLSVHDATCTFENIDGLTAVATESYLGPGLFQPPSPKRREELFEEILDMHTGFLKALKNLVKPGTEIIMCVPFYSDQGKFYFCENLLEMVGSLGYSIGAFVGPEVLEAINLKPSRRGTVLYVRKGQVVGREILLLKS